MNNKYEKKLLKSLKNSYNYEMSKQKMLICEICQSRNYRYKAADNKERLIIKKFCPQCNSHQIHKEEK